MSSDKNSQVANAASFYELLVHKMQLSATLAVSFLALPSESRKQVN